MVPTYNLSSRHPVFSSPHPGKTECRDEKTGCEDAKNGVQRREKRGAEKRKTGCGEEKNRVPSREKEDKLYFGATVHSIESFLVLIAIGPEKGSPHTPRLGHILP